MNALNTIVRDTAEDDLEAAVASAEAWTEVAWPIIQASIELDRVIDDTLCKLRQMAPDRRSEFDEAARPIRNARDELDGIVEGIRDNFLADHMPAQPRPGASEAEWDARDDFSDELERRVTSAKDFVKLVEREDYDAFLRGGL